MKKRAKEIQDWIDFAAEDLQAAEILLKEEIYNQACFHAQQCVEKLLKAALLTKGIHFPKIHDLKELFKQCLDAGVLSLMAYQERIFFLSLFYIPTRYPDAVVGALPDRLPNEKDAREAVETAQILFKLLG